MGGHFEIDGLNEEINLLKEKTNEQNFYDDVSLSTEILTKLSKLQKEVKE